VDKGELDRAEFRIFVQKEKIFVQEWARTLTRADKYSKPAREELKPAFATADNVISLGE